MGEKKEKTEKQNSYPSKQNISFWISGLSKAGRDNNPRVVWYQRKWGCLSEWWGTPTKARLLADHLFRLDPIAKLLPILFLLTSISSSTSIWRGGGVKWHPHLEGALTSPEIRGTLCVRPFPQWDLGLYRRQSRVSPYRPIPAPWGYRHFFTITLHSVPNASLSIWGAFLFVCSCFY